MPNTLFDSNKGDRLRGVGAGAAALAAAAMNTDPRARRPKRPGI